jgi:hypothetical protein
MEIHMKKIIALLAVTLLFLGCSSKSEENKNAEARLVVGKSLADLSLKDQNEKPSKLNADTKIVFFSFSKPTGHACNEFLASKPADFLTQHQAVYVADVSAAPGIIKNMFILPDLKELKFPILLINDDKLSAEYQKGMQRDSIVVVYLDNLKITKIENLKDAKELDTLFGK